MKIGEKHYRTIWLTADKKTVQIIDQRREGLPHKFEIVDLKTSEDMTRAIKEMYVRGAGLIGASAGYGMYLACLEAPKTNFEEFIYNAGKKLKSTRPTAVNLAWAVDRQLREISKGKTSEEKIKIALDTAELIANEDADYCKRIGEQGVRIIEEISKRKNGGTVNILTHCNAGWLAFVDYGSATAPIYAAQDKNIDVHVWVDVTGPWNQGSRLTAWELANHGIPHHVIADNTGGHLMQQGAVDMVITGADRVTRTGDAANKIGTYLKALAAKDNNVPFYVALPSSTFDWSIKNGKEIPIEEREPEEVKYAYGYSEDSKKVEKVLIANRESPATNYSFDVTPARLITGLITERGICKASEKDILKLYPEQKNG